MAKKSHNSSALRPAWRDRWQGPALAFGTFLLLAGLVANFRASPQHDFDGALDDIEALLQQREPQAALDRLNQEIGPTIATTPGVVSDVRARFHLLRGDAVSFIQSETPASNPGNFRLVIEEYDEAERLLVPLSPERVARYAAALVEMGRDDDAIRLLRTLPGELAQTRHGLIRKVIERMIGRPGSDPAKSIELLVELADDATLSPEDRVWVIGAQARLRLESGFIEEAVNHLLVALQRRAELPNTETAPLYLLLTRGYLELGMLSEAEQNLKRATERLAPADRQMAQAHRLAGRIAQNRGELDRARDEFAVIVTEFTSSDIWIDGLLGLAEAQARLSELAPAFETYDRLVERLNTGASSSGVTRERVTGSLLDQVSGGLAREDYGAALHFAQIAADLYPDDKPPAPVSLALARSGRLLADETLATVRLSPDEPPDPSLLDPVTRAEVRTRYNDAGEQYLAHARSMILTDDNAFADSLWNAGECFDLAGELDKAIAVFSEYANGRPNDPRRPAAEFKLAQTHQARGEYGLAAGLYRGLIEENPNSGEGTQSYVWLAKALLQDPEPDNDTDAERLLERVVSGRMLAPEALDFRMGLKALARLYYHDRRNDQAIQRLDEIVRRYPQDAEIDLLRYELADSHRRLAEDLEVNLRQAMPEAQRKRLQEERRGHLLEAMNLFETVRARLQGIDARRLTPVERTSLRNAYFYKADTAFDLGQYDQAIEYYDTAAQRFAEEPISLAAMAQIVSAFIAQGRFAEARKANARARQRLAEFPESAFDSGDLPFTRAHWERWLDSTDALSRGEESSARTAIATDEPG